jgi:phage replication O-like protein O
MANPQKEDGYVAIANEVMDALCRSSPGGSEAQVLLAILRKTYGWHKTSDRISISQLSEMTGVSRRMVIYAIKNLEAKHMITVERQRIRGHHEVNSIAFQKDYEKWVVQEIDGSARKCSSYRQTIEKQKQKYRVVQENDRETKGSARNGSSHDVTTEDEKQNDLGSARNGSTGGGSVKSCTHKRHKDKDKRHSPEKTNSTSKKPPVTLTGEQADRFSRFYAAYPKKRAKQDAIKAWRKISPENGLFETIMAAVVKQKRSDDWTRENGRFIPNPASWLNGRRWEDEVEISPLRRKSTW